MLNLKEYLLTYNNLIFSNDACYKLEILSKKLLIHRENSKRLLIFGNGASSSISSHAALDFTKQGKLTSLCFHDPSLLTAFSNDYGYENVYKEIIRAYHQTDDIVIFISTSGESPNVINACNFANELNLFTISFTGRRESNTLKGISKMSFWVDSHAYNIVENTHSIWITSVIDYLIGKAVYDVS